METNRIIPRSNGRIKTLFFLQSIATSPTTPAMDALIGKLPKTAGILIIFLLLCTFQMIQSEYI